MTDTEVLPVIQPSSSPPLSVKRIAIFAATPWECAAVQAGLPSGREEVIDAVRVFIARVAACEYWMIRTGVGPEKAGRVANRILPRHSWDVAVSTGFACALGSAQVGDFIVATEATDDVTGLKASARPMGGDDDTRNRMLSLISQMPAGIHEGLMLSVARIVCYASEKERLAHSSGATGLDMESAALARAAREARVSFIAVRTVSDLADEDLPLDFNLFLRPTGWLAGIGSVLAAPSRLAGLARLRRQSRLAAANLSRFFEAFSTSSSPASLAMCR